MKSSLTILSILACALLGVQCSFEVTDVNANFGTVIKDYYLAFQKIMPCGYAALDIPKLAPFSLNKWKINTKFQGNSIVGDLTDIKAVGMEDYEIKTSTYDDKTGWFELEILQPNVNLRAKYNLDAKLNILGLPVDLPGKGILDLQLSMSHTTLKFKLLPTKNGIQISDYYTHMRVENIDFNNLNEDWTPELNALVNSITNEVTPYVLFKIQPYLNSYLNSVIVPESNKQLAYVSFSSLITSLKQLTADFKAVTCDNV